ncbi:MAG: hypothetical protein C0439_19250, partial [Pseudomonas sp.]|nr:hypothetical protein [Pseudomonas sp.]
SVHHTHGNVGADYQRAGSIINGIVLPVLAWVALMAHDIVLLLFGEQWLAAVPAIPWLCAATAIATLFSLSAQTVTSVGKPFIAIPPLIILIVGKLAAIYLVYDGSLRSFAIGMMIGEILSMPMYIYINRVLFKVPILKWVVDVAKTFCSVAVGAAVLFTLIEHFLKSTPILLRILVTLPTIIVVCTALFQMLSLPIASELRNAVKSLASK